MNLPARPLIRTATTVDEMVRAVADDIVSGRLAPGERLDEGGLAKRFSVSRTPVRETLGQLAAMGLIDKRPNRAAIVALLSDESLAAMFEAMAELEAACARLAALRMTAAERRALDDLHRRSAELVRAADEDLYDAANVRFHGLIYAGCRSDHLHGLAAATRARLAPFRRAQFRVDDRLTRSWSEHDLIVAAILRGDAAAAAEATRAHVLTVSTASAAFVSAHRAGDRP